MAVLVALAPVLYRRYDRGTYAWQSAFFKLAIVALCRIWYRLRVVGEGTVPRDGPVILAANHTCSIDPLLLVCICPGRVPVFFVAEEFSGAPVVRRAVRLSESVAVKRDGTDFGATRAVLRRLSDGKPVGIFPEGRIAEPGQRLEPKAGVALLALRTGAPVIPIHIAGTRYSSSVFWPIFFRHRARVTIGRPVDLSDIDPDRRDHARLALATDRIMQAIRDLA